MAEKMDSEDLFNYVIESVAFRDEMDKYGDPVSIVRLGDKYQGHTVKGIIVKSATLNVEDTDRLTLTFVHPSGLLTHIPSAYIVNYVAHPAG